MKSRANSFEKRREDELTKRVKERRATLLKNQSFEFENQDFDEQNVKDTLERLPVNEYEELKNGNIQYHPKVDDVECVKLFIFSTLSINSSTYKMVRKTKWMILSSKGRFALRFILLLIVAFGIFMFHNIISNKLSHEIQQIESRQIIPQRLFPIADVDKWNEQVNLGKTLMGQSKVVIATTLRDAESEVRAIKPLVKEIAKQFKESVILAVENDSEDGTRKQLLEWAKEDSNVKVLGCGINSDKCELKLARTISHEHEQLRMEKMALLRNIYLKYVKENFSDFDYLIVWDFDRVGTLYYDSVWSSFGYFDSDKDKNSIDGICSNGLKPNTLLGWLYYDPFAHKEMEDDPVPYHDWYVQYKMRTLLKRGLPLHKVKSCFGGLSIYRIASVLSKNAIYDYSRTEEVICEHVFFNSVLNMFVNPSMFYLVDSRPD